MRRLKAWRFALPERAEGRSVQVTTIPGYDPRYLQGIEYFNECDFFEAHEVWEELWSEYQGPSRRFYQGLIQVAVCLHHFGNGNTRGAKKLYFGSRGYLDDYQPFHEGLPVSAFLDQLQACCAAILDSEEEYPKVEIDVDLIPEIHLQSSADEPN
jgi:predicted metal-dependent hydrolase